MSERPVFQSERAAEDGRHQHRYKIFDNLVEVASRERTVANGEEFSEWVQFAETNGYYSREEVNRLIDVLYGLDPTEAGGA